MSTWIFSFFLFQINLKPGLVYGDTMLILLLFLSSSLLIGNAIGCSSNKEDRDQKDRDRALTDHFNEIGALKLEEIQG